MRNEVPALSRFLSNIQFSQQTYCLEHYLAILGGYQLLHEGGPPKIFLQIFFCKDEHLSSHKTPKYKTPTIFTSYEQYFETLTHNNYCNTANPEKARKERVVPPLTWCWGSRQEGGQHEGGNMEMKNIFHRNISAVQIGMRMKGGGSACCKSGYCTKCAPDIPRAP